MTRPSPACSELHHRKTYRIGRPWLRTRTFVERFGLHFRATFAGARARIIARAKKRLAKRSDITWLASNIPPPCGAWAACADLTVCMNVVTMPQERIAGRCGTASRASPRETVTR